MGYNRDASGNRIQAFPQRAIGNTSFKRIDNGTEPMNVDGTPAGSAAVIWNGEDTYWTPSGTGSPSSGAAHSGSYGWDTGVAAKDAITKFDSGSMQDIAGTYATLEFWMDPQAFPNGSFLSLQWLNDSDGNVGSRLDVNDYVTNFDLDVWQKVTIPIADFLLPGNAQKLQFQYRKVVGQHFYLDDLELHASGGGDGPFTYRVNAPDENTIYHATMIVVVMAGAGSGWNPTTFANISALDNGLLLRQRRISTGETLWSINAKDNIELFGRYHPQDDVTFANGDLLVGFMVKPGKEASITVTDDDVLEYVVRDDLSSVASMRAYVHYGVEVVS